MSAFVLVFFALVYVKAETLEVIFEDAAPPWSEKDGTGRANDIVKAAFNAVHLDVKYTVQPYDRCKNNVVSGNVPACMSMSYSEETKDSVVFSEKPLFTCSSDYYYNLNKPNKIRSTQDITKETKIGVMVGYEYPANVNELKKKGVIFIEVRSIQSALKKLDNSEIDIALINNNGDPDTFAKNSPRIGLAFTAGKLNSHIGFSRKHPRGLWLKSKFDEGYRLIEKNGTLKQIENQWKK